LLAQLRKLAARSAELREVALEKEAGLLSSAGSAIAGWAGRNPMTALGAGVTAAMAPGAAMNSYKKHKAGFNPETQKAMLGQAPVPPQQG